MINQQLLDYIKKQLESGQGEESLANALSVSGWPAEDIKEAFATIKNAGDQSVPMPVPPANNFILPGAVSLLKESLSLYKQRWKTFWGIIIIPVFIAVFSSWAIGRVSGAAGLALAAAIIMWILNGVIGIWSQTSLLYAIKDSPERIGVRDSYRRGWHKILPFFVVSWLVGWVTFGGLVLLIIPGVIFSVWFSLAIFVLIGENTGGLAALLKSQEYVRGKWGSVCWRFFFIGFVAILFYLVFIGLIFIFPSLEKSLFGQIIGIVLSIILAPLPTIYSFLVYQKLKDIRGQVVLAPSQGKKVLFGLIGILGILAAVIAAVFSLKTLMFYYDTPGLEGTMFQSSGNPRSLARDALRQSDMRQIASAMEMHWGDDGKYLISPVTPTAIPPYMSSVPQDPQTKSFYGWVDNLSDGQKFCVYAALENKKDCSKARYYVASQKGSYEVCDVENWTLNCP